MSSPFNVFEGLSKAKDKSSQRPKPEIGKAWYLIDRVRKLDNRTGGFRVVIDLTCLVPVAEGVGDGGVNRGPDRPGTQVSLCIHGGDYFLDNFRDFVMKCTGLDSSRELDMANILAPEAPYEGMDPRIKVHPGKSELERIAYMWDNVLPNQVCALDPYDAGALDRQVVVEINTIEKRVFAKRDRSKPAGPGNQVFDEHGKPISDVYPNSYFNRKVSKAELKDALGDEGIKRFFGSVENFNALDD